MSKPSEKAYIEPLNMIACETLEELAEYLGREYTTKEIWGQLPEALARAAEIGAETQHRKTWALVMDYVDSQLSKKFVGCRVYQVVGYFPEQECPPIEVTKDK
jgi:hypothetical protein